MKANLPVATTNPVFSFEGHTVRVVMDEKGDPWFVVKDVLQGLDINREAANACRTLAADEKRVYDARESLRKEKGQFASFVTLVSESGLYKLTLRANPGSNPTVKKFQDWVTREVLPSIRRDGGYIMGEEKVRSGEMSEDEFILKAMTILKSKAERLTEERDNLKGIVDAHLVNLTIDEWRALNGQYLTRSTILTLAHRMKKRLAQLGVEVPRESRTFEHPKRKGHLIPTSVKVYPKNILDEVASKELGLKVNMQSRTSRAA